MGIKKFINTVTESLGLEDIQSDKKKKALKLLIKKLSAKRRELKKSLNKKVDKKQKKDIEEDYHIVTVQLKKGIKILKKLNSEK
jgi:formate-dependent nitrite reductase cytochrome c552 subunit